jgi:hypothetical protein
MVDQLSDCHGLFTLTGNTVNRYENLSGRLGAAPHPGVARM